MTATGFCCIGNTLLTHKLRGVVWYRRWAGRSIFQSQKRAGFWLLSQVRGKKHAQRTLRYTLRQRVNDSSASVKHCTKMSAADALAGAATSTSSSAMDPKNVLIAQVLSLNLPEDKLGSILLDDKPSVPSPFAATRPPRGRKLASDSKSASHTTQRTVSVLHCDV